MRSPRPVEKLRIGIALACLLAASAASAAEAVAPPTSSSHTNSDPAVVACAEAVARKVQTRYESIRDLQADFEQVTRSVSFGNTEMAGAGAMRGSVVFAKPGKMRWSYQEPAPSLMVSDGSTLWIYDPQAREASHLPVDKGYLSGAALQFLMGEGDMLEAFTVGSDHCVAGSDDPVVLEILPRSPASYERMTLRASPGTGDIQETTIIDLFGNETTMRFSGLRTNVGVDPKLFEWKPPADVTVVDLLAPP